MLGKDQEASASAAQAFHKALTSGSYAAPVITKKHPSSTAADTRIEALLAQLEAQQSAADWRISDLEGRLGRMATLRAAAEHRLAQQVAEAQEQAAQWEAAAADIQKQLVHVRSGAEAERTRAAEAVQAAGESSAQMVALSEALAVAQGVLGAREPFVASLESELARERARASASEAALMKQLDAARSELNNSTQALAAERTAANAAAAAAAASLEEARNRAADLSQQLGSAEAALAAAGGKAQQAVALVSRVAELESALGQAHGLRDDHEVARQHAQTRNAR